MKDYRIIKGINIGYSLIEILIVIGIFAVISVVATQSVFISLRGAKKSESIVNVKEELDYASDIISRQLGNAKAVTSCTSSKIEYISRYESLATFDCVGTPDPQIASSSGGKTYRLTSTKVDITSCTFTCNTVNEKTSIVFEVVGSAKGVGSVEGASYSTSRYIFIQGADRN